MRSFRDFVCVMGLALLLPTIGTAGVISNGQFEEGLVGWPTFDGGISPSNTPTIGNDGNQHVVFSDRGLGSQIEQAISIPANANFLSFDFLFFSNADPSPDATVPDGFQASLFDLRDPSFQPAFFSIDDRREIAMDPAASVANFGELLRDGWTRVRLDLQSFSQQDLLLEFVLLNGTDPSVTSTAYLDNVVITQRSQVIPEHTSLLTFLLLIATATLIRSMRYLVRSPEHVRENFAGS